MSRYIDADELVAWCQRTYQTQSTVAGKAYVNALLTAVDSCSTADVVEVVRCRDCIYYKSNCCFNRQWDFESSVEVPLVRENDYCSYGERREQNEG
jgi:hypothetical protein